MENLISKNAAAEEEEQDELFERETIICSKGQEPLRIDKFLMGRIEGATRNKIQQAIETERVLLNDHPVKSNYKVRPLDKIIIYQDYSPATMKSDISSPVGFKKFNFFFLHFMFTHQHIFHMTAFAERIY